MEEMRRVAVSHSKTSQKWLRRAEEVASWRSNDPLPSWAGEFSSQVVASSSSTSGSSAGDSAASTSLETHQPPALLSAGSMPASSTLELTLGLSSAGNRSTPTGTAAASNGETSSAGASLSASADTDSPGPSKPILGIDIIRGLVAYALRQSNTWHMLGVACVRLWAPILDEHKKEVTWPESMRVEAGTAIVRWKEEKKEREEREREITTQLVRQTGRCRYTGPSSFPN